MSFNAAATPQSFSSAKKELRKIYVNNLPLQSFYCGCEFSARGKKLVPDLDGCGYELRKETQRERAERIEWEHVVPAYDFGRQMQCWQDGGRKNCGKDRNFRRMEADMHNLYPAIGEVNGDRSNFGLTDWNGKSVNYGSCEMVVDFKKRQAQPPVRARGQVARAYLYMADRYNLRLSRSQQKLYAGWNRMYPADANECRRHQLVSKKQGWENPFIAEQCN
nr:endonuclease [Ferrimonas senticii]